MYSRRRTGEIHEQGVLVRISGRVPLTAYQSDIWITSSLNPDLPQFNSFVYERLTGKLDLELLTACVDRAVRTNDGLRLRFDEEDGTPYQWVADETPEIEVVDLSGEPDPRAEIGRASCRERVFITV